MNDVTSVLNKRILVLERSFGAWRGVVYSVAYGYVIDVVMPDSECSLRHARDRRYYPWEHNINQLNGEPQDFVTHRQAIRVTALQQGASPEAVRLLHADQAFTKEEVNTMAEKLKKQADKKKAAPKKADTPKKGKGNPEALKKAREAAKDKGPDVRKITVLVKENPYREGSGRAASWDALKGAKTVEDYKNNGGKIKYISRWESEGRIKLS